MRFRSPLQSYPFVGNPGLKICLITLLSFLCPRVSSDIKCVLLGVSLKNIYLNYKVSSIYSPTRVKQRVYTFIGY